MSSTTSQYSSTFHSFFNKYNTSTETETKLDFVSSIWDDDLILRLDEKTGNSYGVIQFPKGINATNYLAPVLEKKGMHIKSCYVPKEKSHITRYHELLNYKLVLMQILKILLLPTILVLLLP